MSGLPERIADFSELADPEAKVCYRAQPDGSYMLVPAAGEVYRQMLVDEADFLAKHEADMAKHEAEHNATMAGLTRQIIGGSAHNALLAAGAERDLIDAAAALFCQQTKLRLEVIDERPTGRVLVDEPGAHADVTFAAQAWLAGPAGRPYRGRRMDGPGRFTQALRAILQ